MEPPGTAPGSDPLITSAFMSIVPRDTFDISARAQARKRRMAGVKIAYRTCTEAVRTNGQGMCNLYSLTSAQSAITDLVDLWNDETGNLPPMTGIYPDYPAPVITQTSEGRIMQMMRWGMPSPAFALKGKKTDKGVTNIRNTASPHWRRWLTPANRCVVPFSSFAECQFIDGERPKTIWFAPTGLQKTLFFAGIWTTWTSVRTLKEGETTNKLFAFLTVKPNNVVGPIHPKSMPVVLRSREAVTHWLSAPMDDALKQQRPFPDEGIMVVDGPV